MNIKKLRERFASHLGDERYRRFLKQFNGSCRQKKSLNYWHEKEWDIFCKEFPEYLELNFDEMIPVFRVCYIHLRELYDATIPIIKDLACMYHKPDSDAAPRPYASRYSIDSSVFAGQNVLIVDRCPECFDGISEEDPETVRRGIEDWLKRDSR